MSPAPARKTEAAADPEVVAPAPAEPTSAPARILIVDDDRRNLLALAEVLGNIADVVTAASGEEALRHLLRERFAVIILDVLMPEMDGYETARLVRRREQSRDTPIIFLTAINKEDAHLLRGYDSGAVDYVFKPLEPLIIRSKVSVFVSLYEKTREIEQKAAVEQQLLRERLAAEREHTRAVEALRRAEERQEVLLRALPLALYTQAEADGEASRRFVAGNVLALTGYDAAAFDSDPDLWRARVHPEDAPAVNLPVGPDGRTTEFRWRHADGSYRYLFDQAIRLPGPQGTVAGTIRDVSEQHLLQEQLLQAQKIDAVGKLTGGIAHDFNNLLASVLGGLNLIERRTPLDPRAGEILGMTRNALLQGKQLIDRMLAFSRRQSLTPQAVRLDEVGRTLDALLAPVLGGLVVLRWDMPDDLWAVFVDRAQLERALMNLVINARDAMPSGGAVAIGLANRTVEERAPDLPAGQYVVVSIADSGGGIPAELIDKVIEPFFTTKDVGKGTGLGLSTAYGFARQSGGTLRLASVVGSGTTVEVWLPRARETGQTAADAAAAEPQVAGPPARPVSILLVDDTESLRAFTQTQLAEEGYTVASAAGGAEALAMIERTPEAFDVIVTDYAMPVLSGLDVVRFARSVRANQPAVLITGYADQSVIAGRPADVPVLSKPFALPALMQAIAAATKGA
jgi:signal transduction histidine kinase